MNQSLRIVFGIILFTLIWFSNSFSKEDPRWGLLPAASYTEETSWQAGALATWFLKADRGEQPGEIILASLYSLKKQFQILFRPTLRFKKDLWRVDPGLDYYNWPAEFYAWGNDSPDSAKRYTMKRVITDNTVQRRFGKSIFTGLQLQLEHATIKWSHSQDANGLKGANGSNRLGIGLQVSRDTRDNLNAASKGTLVSVRSIQMLSSDENNFNHQELDLRSYQSFFRTHVLATRMNFQSLLGSPSFRDGVGPDGTKILRGLQNGRYFDRKTLAFQAEYRFPLFWRFGMTVFSEVAQVAPKVSDFGWNQFHSALGLGGRFALNPKRKFNVRGDLSFVNGKAGMTIYVKEAF